MASTVHLFAIVIAITSSASEPVAVVSALGFDKLRVHLPARPGDELSKHITCLEARPSASRRGVGVLRIRGELSNQRGWLVFSYESAVMVQCRPDGAGLSSG